MILLKVKKAGYTIAIPGLKAFRSPVDIDISKLDIRVVSMYLESAGISEYEIVAKNKDDVEIYTEKDFQKPKKKEESGIEKRFGKIEKLLLDLVNRNETKSTTVDQEQILSKLDRLEKKFSERNSESVIATKKNNNIEDEEYNSFIPEIDTSDMKLKSSDNTKTIKQEGNPEEAAELLAGLIGKKKRGK